MQRFPSQRTLGLRLFEVLRMLIYDKYSVCPDWLPSHCPDFPRRQHKSELVWATVGWSPGARRGSIYFQYLDTISICKCTEWLVDFCSSLFELHATADCSRATPTVSFLRRDIRWTDRLESAIVQRLKVKYVGPQHLGKQKVFCLQQRKETNNERYTVS